MFIKSKRKGTPRRWKAVVVLCLLIIASGIAAYWLLPTPTDDEIIYVQGGNLWRIPFGGQNPPEKLTYFTEWGSTIWLFDISADGRYIIFEGSMGSWIRLLDLDTGEVRLVRDCQAEDADCISVHFNPARNLILYTFDIYPAGSVWTYDVRSDLHTQLEGISGRSIYAHWLDEQHIIYKSSDYGNQIYNIESNTAITPDDLGVEYIPPNVAHNGIIAILPIDYQSSDCLTIIPTVSVNGTHSELNLNLPAHQCFSNFGYRELWSPDGSKIAYATVNPNGDFAIVVQDVATGETSTVARPTGKPTGMRWNADGTRLLVTLVYMDNRNDDHVVAYDLNTGETAVIENVTYAAWQP